MLEMACSSWTNGNALPLGFAERVCAEASLDLPIACTVELRSKIPDLDPHNHCALYDAIERVFNLAVPLLARLRLPSLALPGPLKAAVKAQCIMLDKGERYE